MSLSCDPDNLVSALLFVEKVANRSVVESMNRAGLHTIIGSKGRKGAMQLTPQASRSAIQSIPLRVIQGFIIRRAKKNGTWPLPQHEVKRQAMAEKRRRLSAVGYHAFPGWNNASVAMGGRGLKKVNRHFNQSDARFGKGQKATVFSKLASISNTTPAIERIGFPALQQGLDNAADDLVDYGTKKLQQQLNKVKP
jgi:hypothetical protein